MRPIFINLGMIAFLFAGYCHAEIANIIPNDKAGASTGAKAFGSTSTQSSKDTTANACERMMEKTVDLYTGQYSESFPLASLSGRGGMGYDLVLHYNGNVTQTAKSVNYKDQASPFGLGFSVGSQAITVDHGSTASLEDDTYRLMIDGSSTKLRRVTGNRFITENGDPWVVVRHIDTISNVPTVVGWTITKEDGTIYQYGDMSATFDSLNGTRTILRYGDFVGGGVTNDDKPYPYQWDLTKISDAGNLNWVKINYLRDSAYLQVMDTTTGALTQSANPYIRASYPCRILAADSNEIVITYDDREDYQSFYGVNTYEFYYKRKATGVQRRAADGTVISNIAFEYDYLDRDGNSSLKKLALRTIKKQSGDESVFLPPTCFYYDNTASDAAYGRIKKVLYPMGAVKEIDYRVINDTANISRLDSTLTYNEQWSRESQYYRSMLYANGRMFFHYSSGVPTIAYWDGYWRMDTANIYTSQYGQNNQLDEPAVSDDDWMAYYDRRTEKIIVKRWKGGYWETSALTDTSHSIVRGSNENVYMTAGKDCFIVAVGPYGPDPELSYNTRHLHRGYYFHWDGKSWRRAVVVNNYDWNGQLLSMKVNNCMFAFMLWQYDRKMTTCNAAICCDKSYLNKAIFGRYDIENNTVSVVTNGDWHYGYSPFAGNDPYVVGSSYIAFIADSGYAFCSPVQVVKYEVQSYQWINGWVEQHLIDGSGEQSFYTLSLLPNGYAALPHEQTYFKTVFFKGSSMIVKTASIPNNYSPAYPIKYIYTSNHSLITETFEAGIIDLFEWDGLDWVRSLDHVLIGNVAEKPVELYGDAYAIGPGLALRRYMGNGQWSPVESVTRPPDSSDVLYWANDAASTDEYLARREALFGSTAGIGDSNFIYLYYPFYYGNYRYHRQCLNVPRTSNSANGWSTRFYPAGDYLFQVDAGQYNNSVNCFSDIMAYRKHDRLFKGKPELVVVDTLKLYNYDQDPDPAIQSFSYFGGLLDGNGTTPHFAKIQVSMPYFQSASGPEGFTRHYFFNDIDSTGFYDPIVYDSSVSDSMFFPDLKATNIYRVANGGYRLDGSEYYRESFSDTGELIGNSTTYTRSFYSLHNVPDSSEVLNIYRVCKDSTRQMHDFVTTMTTFEYDPYNGQITKSRDKHRLTNTFLVNEYAYAYTSVGTMKNDNAISQVQTETRSYDSCGTIRKLSKASRRFAKHGDWKAVEEYAWRNIVNQPNDSISVWHADAFDQYGNVISSHDGAGVVTAEKYDRLGANVIGAAVNCSPTEFLVQDFEQVPGNYQQGLGWDNWYLFKTLLGLGAVDTTDAYTGKACYKINDDALQNGDNRGAWRKINASDLSGNLYQFSCWVKANANVLVYCWCNNASGDTCTNGYKYLSFSGLSSTTWQKIEGVFNLSNVNRQCLDNIVVQLVMADPGSDTTKFAKFDDVRFHPIDAHVTSSVYNKSSNLLAADVDLNNIPTIYEYDKLNRPMTSFNHARDTVAHYEYRVPYDYPTSRDTLTGRATVRHGYHSPGGSSKKIVMDFDQTIAFHLYYLGYGPCVSCCAAPNNVSYAYVMRHHAGIVDTFQIYQTCCGTCSPSNEYDDSVAVNAGDTIEVAARSTNCYSLGSCAPYDSATASIEYAYLKTSLSSFTQDTTTIEIDCPNNRRDSAFQVLTYDQEISYELIVCAYAHSGPCGAKIMSSGHIGGFPGDDRSVDSIIGFPNSAINTTHSGSFWAYAGDTITVVAQLYDTVITDTNACNPPRPARAVASFSFAYAGVGDYMVPAYITQSPYYIKTTTYNKSDLSADTMVTYYDAFGRALQTRSLDQTNGTLTRVSDAAEYDSRGRVVRKYKPYYDSQYPYGLMDYSAADSVAIEAQDYYDGNSVADCGTAPYTEYSYFPEYRGRLQEIALPGNNWKKGSGHTTRYRYVTGIFSGSVQGDSVTTVDPDNDTTATVTDAFNVINNRYDCYKNSRGHSFILNTRSYNSVDGLLDSVRVFNDSGTTVIESATTRRFRYNSLGQDTMIWRVDYGTVRMFYDKIGNLRFIQNDKLASASKFAYYKYDKFNRKIEEGECKKTISSINAFCQDSADSRNFPDSALSDSVRTRMYTWQYDYRIENSVVTALNYGTVSTAQNADGSYYRKYQYFPLEGKDSVAVKLLITGGQNKAIVHKYDVASGRPIKLTVYPHQQRSDARSFRYLYDQLSGRLTAIRESGIDTNYTFNRDLAAYKYLANGQPQYIYLGHFVRTISPDSNYVAHTLYYQYTPLDLLRSINSPGLVSTSLTGRTSHFAMTLTYDSAGTGYFNGRVKSASYVNSSSMGRETIPYAYTYNELGWLTAAIHSGDPNDYWDEEYYYNYLGNRDSVEWENTTKVLYHYSTATPGSSRLLNASVLRSGWQTMRVFDTTGNLVQDSGNVLTYDYRDLMTGATLNQTYPGATNNSMDFNYDEAGQRMRKRTYNYWHVWVDGGGGGIGQESIIQSGEGTDELSMSDSMVQSDSIGVDGSDSDDGSSIQPGGVETNSSSGSGWVDYSQTSEFHYLYDGSVLLGIFDGRDSALEVYANSPSGAVAVYDHNRTTGRYYLLKDQVGSTRVTVNDAGSVVQYINYRPFGVVGENYTTYNEPLKFTGKEWDTFRTFNFDYFGARYYDAQYGIFATTDPVPKDNQALGLYGYADNNPISKLDPDGKLVEWVFIAAAVAAAVLGNADYANTPVETGDTYNLTPVEREIGDALIITGVLSAGSSFSRMATTEADATSVSGAGTRAGTQAADDALASSKGAGLADNAASAERSIGHHSDPKFMGGDPKQELTLTPKGVHNQLHHDMNDFLRRQANEAGEHMRPQRGNAGEVIRTNFTRESRLKTIADFYKLNRVKYPEAAKDFFKQHPDLK